MKEYCQNRIPNLYIDFGYYVRCLGVAQVQEDYEFLFKLSSKQWKVEFIFKIINFECENVTKHHKIMLSHNSFEEQLI